METALYEKHIEGGQVTKGDIQTKSNEGPKQVHGIYEGKSEAKDKGNVLQGPDCNEVRQDEQIRSGDTGNSIARSR